MKNHRSISVVSTVIGELFYVYYENNLLTIIHVQYTSHRYFNMSIGSYGSVGDVLIRKSFCSLLNTKKSITGFIENY